MLSIGVQLSVSDFALVAKRCVDSLNVANHTSTQTFTFLA